jgi:hypothetical protein
LDSHDEATALGCSNQVVNSDRAIVVGCENLVESARRSIVLGCDIVNRGRDAVIVRPGMQTYINDENELITGQGAQLPLRGAAGGGGVMVGVVQRMERRAKTPTKKVSRR